MSPLELSKPTTVGLHRWNIAEAQDTHLKIDFIVQVLKKEMKKFLITIYENTNKQWNEMNK